MIHGRPDIANNLNTGWLGASRPNGEPVHLEPSSMDVHLGEKIAYTDDQSPVDVTDRNTYPEYSYANVDDSMIWPGEFWLATTEEQIDLPNDTVAQLHGRSSLGRIGLFIHNAGLIDAGFDGQVTLELFNSESYPIKLESGMRIAQLTFHEHRTAPEVAYSSRNGNKYNGQSGPTPSELYEDFE